MEAWYLFVLAGLICGIFSATFGVGAGIIMIPALVLLFSMPQKSAQGICLAVMVPMALVGALRYKLNPQIELDIGVIGLLCIGAVVGAWIGAGIAGWLPASVLRKLFALIMIVAAIRMLTTSPASKTPKAEAGGQQTACSSETEDAQET
jgi:uncharacterized protein